MKKNLVKEKIKRGEIALGVAITISSPEVTEILANLGFDWLFIDMEHAPLEVKDVEHIIQAIEYTDVTPIVRVPSNDPVVIKRVLDVGALGIIVPLVSSRKDAEHALRACKYPPRGIRGCGPRRAALYGLKLEEYLNRADEEIMVVIQIETKEAVNNLKEILQVKGIDATFVGPMDLSASYGLLGQPNHPKIKEIIRKIAKAHKGTGVIPGIASSIDMLKEHIAMGYKLINIASDCGLIIDKGKEIISLANKLCTEYSSQ